MVRSAPRTRQPASVSTSGFQDRSSDTPRVYFEKDVLRVGRFQVGSRTWQVNRQTLSELSQHFLQARAHGVRVPVVWNHSHDARDRIGMVTRLWVRGKTLVARFWAAAAADVDRLRYHGHEVSVEISQPWHDGHGHHYPRMITHVGVVMLPVLASQHDFREQGRRSASQPPFNDPLMKQVSLFSLASGAAAMPASPATTTTIKRSSNDQPRTAVSAEALAELIATLNALLEEVAKNSPDSPSPTSVLLPPGSSLEAIVAHLQRFLREWRKTGAAEAKQASDDISLSLPTSSTTVGDQVSDAAALQAELAMVRAELAAAQSELARQQETQSAERRRAFVSQVDRLLAEGRLLPADRAALLAAGEPAQFALSLLQPFQRIPAGSAVPVSGIARASAVSAPPAHEPRPTLTDERIDEIVRTFHR